MSDISKIFDYNGNPIPFRREGEKVMINATEMAKQFGKTTRDWLINKSTNEFISSLSAVRGIPLTGLVQIKQGGNGDQGTWMHKDVAIEFARWLNPIFAIWCNDRIDELMRLGFTATDLTIERLTNDPDLLISLATQLKQERYAKQKAMEERTKAERLALEARAAEEQERKEKEIAVATIEQQRPDVEFSHNYIDAEGDTVMEVAKRLEDFGYIIAARTCYEFLNAIHFLFKRDGKWCVYETARNLGYVKYGNIKEDEYMMGNPKAPKITNKGFKKILDTIKKKPEVFLNYGKFGNKNY